MDHLIRVVSDTHLEAFLGRAAETLAIDFVPRDDRDKDSILVLAGDISSQPDQLFAFVKALCPRFRFVLYVPGNHEYYRHNFDAWNPTMEDRFKLLEVDNFLFATEGIKCSIVDGVRFVYGTMWADGGPTLADQGRTGFYLNDFRLITRGAAMPLQRFTVQDMMTQFQIAKRQIKAALELPHDGKTVVVTHHLPSRRLVSDRFWPGDGSDGANGGFVGECDDILAGDHAPVLWIHGHTHDTINTKLWNTRIVCNPAGYRGEWMNPPFNTFMKPNKNGSRETVPVFVSI